MCTVCEKMVDYEKRLQALEKRNEELERIVTSGFGVTVTYSVKEAAGLIKRSAYTVTELIRNGRIEASREGLDGHWIITQEAINNYIKSTQNKSHGGLNVTYQSRG